MARINKWGRDRFEVSAGRGLEAQGDQVPDALNWRAVPQVPYCHWPRWYGGLQME